MSGDLRWMVFKVKQKSQAEYKNMTMRQASFAGSNLFVPPVRGYPIKFNWPYDYFSLVELAQLEVENVIVPGATGSAATVAAQSNHGGGT